MNSQGRARCVAGVVKALAKVGIVAVWDREAGGFLLMREDSRNPGEDLWERALRAPVLVLSEDELESPHCCEIAWRKASHMLHMDAS